MYTQHHTAPKLYTNLYEVLRILQDEMSDVDDATIVATALYLLRSGKIKFLRPLDWCDCDDLTAA